MKLFSRSPRPTERLSSYFKLYAEDHQTSGNQLMHCIGIPLIVISLLGLLSKLLLVDFQLSFLQLDAGVVLLVLAGAGYFYLDWIIAIPYMGLMTGLYFLGRALPVSGLWLIFVVGWIFQGIGHALYEKKSPAFFKNFIHLFIGPLWIFAKWVGYR